jgi:hypothetical protein
MTEDSSDNLRKFLESDDSAMILLGLSMARGSAKASNEILGMVLGLYLFHNDKEIRSIAKTTFGKLAPSDLRKTVKNYWQAEYRNQAWIWDGWMQKMVLDIEDTGINTTYLLARGLISPTEEVDDVRSSILDMLGKRDLSESHITVRSFLKNLTSISRWGYKHQGNVEVASKILKELDL